MYDVTTAAFFNLNERLRARNQRNCAQSLPDYEFVMINIELTEPEFCYCRVHRRPQRDCDEQDTTSPETPHSQVVLATFARSGNFRTVTYNFGTVKICEGKGKYL